MAVSSSARSGLISSAAFVAPTSDDLVAAVLAGDDAVERQRARFRVASPADCVRRLVVQAIDPLLLTAILGRDLAPGWVPLLERYYAQARRQSPATFLDFDRAWDLQRRRWQPLVDDAEAGARPAGPPADSVAPERGPDRAAAVPGAHAASGRARRGLPSRPAAAAAAALPGSAEADEQAEPLVGEDLPEPEPDDELAAGPDPLPVEPLEAGPAESAESDQAAAASRPPDAGRYGLAVLEAARRPDFDLISVFDGCLSEVDGEPHWESFRFGAASLQRGLVRRR